MLAKISAKNQLTLPKSVTAAVGTSEYFEIEVRNRQIILTPVASSEPMQCAPSWQSWIWVNKILLMLLPGHANR